jgi:hypothetical protein
LCRSGRVQPLKRCPGVLETAVRKTFLNPLSLALFDEVNFVVMDGENKAVIFEFVHDMLLER